MFSNRRLAAASLMVAGFLLAVFAAAVGITESTRARYRAMHPLPVPLPTDDASKIVALTIKQRANTLPQRVLADVERGNLYVPDPSNFDSAGTFHVLVLSRDQVELLYYEKDLLLQVKQFISVEDGEREIICLGCWSGELGTALGYPAPSIKPPTKQDSLVESATAVRGSVRGPAIGRVWPGRWDAYTIARIRHTPQLTSRC